MDIEKFYTFGDSKKINHATKFNPIRKRNFIVDNSERDWKVLRYLHDWCETSKEIDVATGYFEIGSLLSLKINEKVSRQIVIIIYF